MGGYTSKCEKSKNHCTLTAKQAKGLLRNCMPIIERYAENKKVFLSPTVRFYRTRCCTKEEHCTNLDTAGYRRGMLADLSVIRDAMLEVCREEGVQLYKVLGTCELLGLKAAMEEDEVERLLGSHPVHMTEEGYVTLAEQMIKLISYPTQLFVGEKSVRPARMRSSIPLLEPGPPRFFWWYENSE